MLDLALAYASDGWPTFPLRAGGKVPATANGFKDATTDPGQITRWWTEQPRANIGLSCGPAGLVIIDIDAHDDGPDGWSSWWHAEPATSPTRRPARSPSPSGAPFWPPPRPASSIPRTTSAENDERRPGGRRSRCPYKPRP